MTIIFFLNLKLYSYLVMEIVHRTTRIERKIEIFLYYEQ